jgi:hypothetical protein
MSPQLSKQSKAHHHVPQFMLRGFAGPGGRLVVVQLRPCLEVHRARHPRRVGRIEHLNSILLPDGSVDDSLEREPLNRLDTVGAIGLRELVEYAQAVEPRGQLRLWNRDWEERVPFTMHVAVMVRGPALRERLDEVALPSLIEHMRSQLDERKRSGLVGADVAETLLGVLERPGAVQLQPPLNRHQAALPDLLTTVTAAIGATHIVSVRRVEKPLLTGSEPVIIFRDADITRGISCGQLLSEADAPVPMWEERGRMLRRVTDLLTATAGLAFAADRHTVVVFLNPETDEGGKLLFFLGKLPQEALSGLLNVKVVAASSWIAGAAGDFMLEMIASAAEAAHASGPESSGTQG